MRESFWTKLRRPFLVQAPMADGTDPPFRRVLAECGKPDVMFTEFVSCDGLCSAAGRVRLLRDLSYSEAERPIVAQLFTANPDRMERCAALIRELKFDGLDINMGCPDRTIEKQGAGAALIKDQKLAGELIEAARKGGRGIPISVKTRIGYSVISTDWIKALLEHEIDAITIHLRTRKEMSKVPAHWELAKTYVELAHGAGTVIVGNGDVRSLGEALERVKETGMDGIMVGRALFGNPWFTRSADVSPRERLGTMLKHAELFHEYFGDSTRNSEEFAGHRKNFAALRKHLLAYIKLNPEFQPLKHDLSIALNLKDIQHAIQSYSR